MPGTFKSDMGGAFKVLQSFDQRYLYLWSLGEVYGGLQRDEGAEGVYSQIIGRYFIDTKSINDSQEYIG